MNKFSKDLVASLGEAVDHAEGKKTATRVVVKARKAKPRKAPRTRARLSTNQ